MEKQEFTPQMMPEMRIQYNPQTGQVHVAGQLDNWKLCHAMLTGAYDVLLSRLASKDDGAKIVKPQLVVPIGRS